jgi:SAM-dependent methyltransferase
MSACRFCSTPLEHVFADLGMSPLANAYLTQEELTRMERFYPLRALLCHRCFLVQLESYETPDAIFGDYAYFSSYSSTWVDHVTRYADAMVERLELDARSRVVEVASNDGVLLKAFQRHGVGVLGVEPAENVGKVAVEQGVPTLIEFFGLDVAQRIHAGGSADLVVGNNVLAHVPDLNDFVDGIKVLLAPTGTVTMEFPHLVKLIAGRQFDTIYHEHFSYFTWITACEVFAAHGLTLFDVEELPTHGGSLRIYGRHDEDLTKPVTDAARALTERELAGGFRELERYQDFSLDVKRYKREILGFLVGLKDQGLSVAGYGAPAKGNTLLNYCGVGTDFLDFTADANPRKQGWYLPGTHVEIRSPDALREAKPDIVLILPWNLEREIREQHAYIAEWGGRFAVLAPSPQIL